MSRPSAKQRGVRSAGAGEDGIRFAAFRRREREQQVLGRDVLIAKVTRFFLGAVENLIELAGHRRLARPAAAGLLRVTRRLTLRLFAQRGDAGSHLLQHRDDDALLLTEQREKQVGVVDERIARPAGEADCLGDRLS